MTSGARSGVPARGAVTSAERKLTFDVARGFMLLLIAMAYAPMYLAHADVGGYGSRPGGGAADQVVSFLATLLLENRAFPLFAILFGYGMVMLITRQQAAGTPEREMRRLLRRRSLWLLVFGLIHAILVFPGEILAAYGLGSMLVGWLLFRPERTIRRVAAILTPVYVVLTSWGMLGLAASGSGANQGVPGYATVEDWVARVAGAPVAPIINIVVFPLLILLVLGMWIGRRKLLEESAEHRTTLWRLAVGGIAISVLGALPSALAGAEVFSISDLGYGGLAALQVLTGICGGVGYAAAFGLIGMRLEQRPGPISRTLSAAGQRSLSVYLFASVGVAIVLHPDLLGLGEHVHRAGAMAVAVGVWLLAVLLARALEAAGKRGPADALLRRLVYRSAT